MKKLIEQIEKAVENKSAQFRLHTLKKYIPTFTAKAIRRELVSRVWGNVTGNRHRYTIEIGKTDGRRFIFVYYDSINAYRTNAKLNIFNVICCMISDYDSYECAPNFKDFIAEFGYNTNDKEQLAEAKRVFNNCQSIYAKANSIFSSYDLEIIRATCSQY